MTIEHGLESAVLALVQLDHLRELTCLFVSFCLTHACGAASMGRGRRIGKKKKKKRKKKEKKEKQVRDLENAPKRPPQETAAGNMCVCECESHAPHRMYCTLMSGKYIGSR